MSCIGNSECLCGACAGTSSQTPQPEINLQGLPAVARRVGTWAQFKESMLARLSSSDYPALHPLKTRDDDDFTIAMLDATSVMLDILTFYQERLANECYLRTAQQTRSLTELSRLIGYQPTPGVAASVYVAFTLTTAPGQPDNPNAPAITIPQGTQMQSVPVQGQAPQTFETSADILAKADWTSLPVQTGLPWVPNQINTFVYLQGTSTQLQPGDLFLVVGNERLGDVNSPCWDLRMAATVTPDGANNRTLVTWAEPLGHGSVGPSTENPGFHVFRQRAALFGYNAIMPQFLGTNSTPPLSNVASLFSGATPDTTQWANYALATTIDLDSAYPQVANGGWVALITPDTETTVRIPPGYVSLHNVTTAAPVTRTNFGISAKITSITPDTTNGFNNTYLRTTMALVQSTQLAVTEQPLSYPLYGGFVSLEVLRNDLGGVQVIALSGTRQKIAFTATGVTAPAFTPDDYSPPRPLVAGEVLTITSAANLPPWANGTPPDWTSQTANPLYVEDAAGRTGSIANASLAWFTLAPSAPGDPVVGEYTLVSLVGNDFLVNGNPDYYHTWFSLTKPLMYCYDRVTTTVNANVGLATAGQSVTELMGSGSAATANQSFTLKQSPLTFVQAVTPTGFASTLEVQANGMDWTEVPSLYEAAPTAQVYATLNQSNGTTDILFGDGQEGATLPTGQNNIQANYRIGSGSAGNVAVGALTTLIDRPLGVSGVTNPSAATGGQDPQTLAGIRQNAPQTVLTLGRAVSITDYQNFASTFAGIAKAYAIWIPSGPTQGVFLTVAGTGGAAVPPGNPTNANLLAALQACGNPLIPISIQTCVETLFQITAKVQYDPAYQQAAVQAEILETLADTFNFASRAFGQGVSMDEVSTVIQNVPGVVAVNVISLVRGVSSLGGDIGQAGAPTVSQWNLWYAAVVNPPLVRPYPDPANGLCCYLPSGNPQASPQPAEILVLDPRTQGVTLGVMS